MPSSDPRSLLTLAECYDSSKWAVANKSESFRKVVSLKPRVDEGDRRQLVAWVLVLGSVVEGQKEIVLVEPMGGS